ncbi:hypothetical protein ACHAW5_000886 [Stephanodiscus triporus]|uniref:Carboxymuconolactone decarboxylase-like domain-containing protein n=1 Tax=Stephanodiscus triporus TaxID=2934178 RepID=A0ABD3NLD4_9STRA
MCPPSSTTGVQKTGKVFTWSTLLRDHTRFFSVLPSYLLAYVGPSSTSLVPKTIESVMLTVNSHNACPYCTGLHGQLARMAGIDAPPDPSDPAVKYARTFALESGRGGDVESSYDELASAIGDGRASSVRALCWALLWGKTTGNTINSVRDKILKLKFGSIRSLELFVLAYYGPLFLVIGVLNAVLTKMPRIPPRASAGLGAVLWVPVAVNIAPLGIVSVALNRGIV